MGKNRTVPVRVRKELVKEWDIRFPTVRRADLVDIMWNTSILKLEAKLRKLDQPKRRQKR